jgi:hypothetical protein
MLAINSANNSFGSLSCTIVHMFLYKFEIPDSALFQLIQSLELYYQKN